MSAENLQHDYLESHAAHLLNLAAAADRTIASSSEQDFVIMPAGQTDCQLVLGKISPAEARSCYVAASGESIEEPEAVHIAHILNAGKLAIAAVTFKVLEGLATIDWTTEQLRRGTITIDEALQLPTLAHGESEFHSLQLTPAVRLQVTKLHDLQHGGDVAQYSFEQSDDLLVSRLIFVKNDERLTGSEATLKPAQDAAYRRWTEDRRLGDLPQVRDLLAGTILNTIVGEQRVNTNNVLADLEAAIAGKVPAANRAQLLAELRERSAALSEAIVQRRQSNPIDPYPDEATLLRWGALLAGG